MSEFAADDGREFIMASTPVEVISLIPHMLGMQPEDVMVLLPVNNTDREVPGAVRVPMPQDYAEVSEMMDALHGVFHTVLKDSPCAAYFYSPHSQLIGYVCARLRLDCLPVVQAIKVYEGRFWDLEQDRPDDPGTPYIAKAMIDAEPPPFRDDLVEQLTGMAPTERLKAYAEYLEQLMPAVMAGDFDDYVHTEARWLLDRLKHMDTLLTDEELFRLGAALGAQRLADLAWAMIEPTTECFTFWTDAASRLSLVDDLLFLAAFVSWHTCRGTHSTIFLEKLMESDPTHRQGLLLQECMIRGLLGSKWTPPPLDQLPVVKEVVTHG